MIYCLGSEEVGGQTEIIPDYNHPSNNRQGASFLGSETCPSGSRENVIDDRIESYDNQ